MSDPTRVFSRRVDNYIRYRPSYPAEIIGLIERQCGLTADWTVADVGSGPGNLARLFLAHGNQVYGIEPNAEMRAAGERLLGEDPRFTSVSGSAEATGLPAASVELVTAGQAFHWFDAARAGDEFRRILRPPRWTALVWNERRSDTPFLAAYDDLLARYDRQYAAARHRDSAASGALERFFAPGGYQVATFANRQTFDLEGLRGRVLSSSYAPLPGQPGHNELRQRLRELFARHQQNGTVALEYFTRVYYGRL